MIKQIVATSLNLYVANSTGLKEFEAICSGYNVYKNMLIWTV